MNAVRARALLIGHALAEDTSLQAAIVAVPAPYRMDDLVLLQAGRLEPALQGLGLPAADARLASLWPAGLRPAQRRQATLPSPRGLQARLFQTLVATGGVLAGQLFAVAAAGRGAALMADLAPSPQAFEPVLRVLEAASLAAGLGLLATVVSAGLVLLLPRRLPAWGRAMLRAEEAARAGALLESGAPPSVRAEVARDFRRLEQVPLTLDELTLVQERAVAEAEVAQERLVEGARAVGMGLCVLIAFVTTAALYQALALVQVAL